ncbi:MAG: glycosyltransferase [Isosphaeraceae bacterium]
MTPPRASVIVPVAGRSGPPRAMLAALVAHTRPPWELIAVLDGADSAVAAYLRGPADLAPFPARVAAHPAGRNFAAACNAGLDAARGDRIVLLAEGAVVPAGWLDQLEALLAAVPGIGIAAPVGADPGILPADAGPDEIGGFARDWLARHRGLWKETERLEGPCLLLERGVLNAAGRLDERLGAGQALDDLISRARANGFRAAAALDLYIHRGGKPPGPSPDPAASRGFVPAPNAIRAMARDAVRRLAQEPAGLAGRAALWESLAAGIADEARSLGSSWGMERFEGADGSAIYMGRAAEFLVLDADGRIFRGSGPGCLGGARGGRLVPSYGRMESRG